MFDMANDNLAKDFGMKVGEIEEFMEMSATFLDSVDLQNGVYEEKGIQLLEEWEKKSDSLLLGNEKTILLSKAENPNEVLDLDAPAPVPVSNSKAPTTSKYNDLFNK
jgi:hypothetical protein